MRLSFGVELKGLETQKDNVKSLSREVLWKAMNKMMNIAIIKAPVDTGRLRSSIHLTPSRPDQSEYILSDGVDYGVHVEFGTRPHFPPTPPLTSWGRRVLGVEQIGYAIARKISLKGTLAQPFFRPALMEVRTIWLRNIASRVLSRV